MSISALKQNQTIALEEAKEDAEDRLSQYITDAFATFSDEFEDYVDGILL